MAPLRILLAEDDPAVRFGLVDLLRTEGHEVTEAGDGAEALAARPEDHDVLITDVLMPGMDGIELMREALRRSPQIFVIIITGHGSIPHAVDAIKSGAWMYLTKPFEPAELFAGLSKIADTLRLRERAQRAGRGDLVGTSPAMRAVYKAIDAAATVKAPVLITGETGTGKELAARAVHEQSERRRGPFIAVNLGAIPRELAESELFGHEAGAFTGADRKRRGCFALARGGTLFLDEINSLPLDLQPKLLRALESGEIWPLGAEKVEQTDCRIIAASNADLEARVAAGEFRQDLFFRLNVITLKMPPLREHPDDIPNIAHELLARLSAGAASDTTLAPDALAALVTFPWPGNVRQLANVIETGRVMALSENPPARAIEARHLPIRAGGAQAYDGLPFRKARNQAADDWARARIAAALAETEGNVSAAARMLQINRTALCRLMARFGIRNEQG